MRMASTDCPSGKKASRFPFENLPPPDNLPDKGDYPPPPDEQECLALWQKYDMLENIRRHSFMVAHLATWLAKRAFELGFPVNVENCRAAGLLHDIAKSWCVKNGGSHAMLGASWVVQETRHFGIAQGVMLHVHWPWQLPQGRDICCLPIFIIYADKRVRHDQCVTLKERFDDLITRYGRTEAARQGIRQSCQQARQIEAALSRQLQWDLNEYSFDSGRLVQ